MQTLRRQDARGLTHRRAAAPPHRTARALWRGLGRLARRWLRTVRHVVGAPDYESYLAHHAACHPDHAPLPPRAFYELFLSWRFGDGPTRCC